MSSGKFYPVWGRNGPASARNEEKQHGHQGSHGGKEGTL